MQTGVACAGVVAGADGTLSDFTALGDNVNIAIRLASSAGVGEILISKATLRGSGWNISEMEQRYLELKDKREPFPAYVLKISP